MSHPISCRQVARPHRARPQVAGPALPTTLTIAPPDDLGAYVARFFVTVIDQAEDAVSDDFLLNEAPVIQFPVQGDWAWEAGDGWTSLCRPMLFGPRGRALRIRARGRSTIAGFVIRPGGWVAFDARPALAIADTIRSVVEDWALSQVRFHRNDDPETIVARLQAVVRHRLKATGTTASAKAAAFEAIVRAESNTPVAQAATSLGMTTAKFDRFVRRHFGHPPKIVLRRSRFLDMAGVMHGLADADVDALAPIRFYDASHLNREFRLFVDMTPGVFARAHTPLLNAELAARQRIEI